jgi:N-acetylglutamate synthase-like GNAT family acetyltransferase
VLENNQQLFGFYALDFSPQGHVELRGLFVEPEFLGRGLGRFL